jgi:hypothetical protein
MKTTSLSLAMALLATPQTTSHQQPLAFTDTLRTSTPRRQAIQTVLQAMPTKQSSETRLDLRRNNPVGRTNVGSSPSLSPTAIQSIVDAEQEFEINLGRAVDTLKKDYPSLLTKNPDWAIYHDDLDVVDPSGVSLHGLNSYKKAFFFIHGVVKMFYCSEKSGLTSIRMGYDWARKCIRCVPVGGALIRCLDLTMELMSFVVLCLLQLGRVSWNVELVPKMIYGGIRNTLHVDGISEYYMDRSTGLITEHKVSHLLINDQTVRPTNGIFNALAEISPVHEPGSVPVFFKHDQQQLWEVNPDSHHENMLSQVKFQTWNPLSNLIRDPSTTSLFSKSSDQAMSIPNNNANLGADSTPYDLDAFQRKNKSRLKFGMPPLTPEEFIKIEEEVRAMDAMNKKKAAYLAEQLSQAQQAKKKSDNFLSNIFGGVLKNGCESNFDCERPQVCCDVGFKKICCSNGLGIVDG